MEQPHGTVTFVFTDIEGSSKLWDTHQDAMRVAVARHDALIRHIAIQTSGYVFKTIGDAFCIAFGSPSDAVRAAIEIQRVLLNESWGAVGAIKVRIAVHRGEVEARDGDYFGGPLNRVARLRDAGHGGQILVTAAIMDALIGTTDESVTCLDKGTHRLKDLAEPEHIYQIEAKGLARDFPALRTLSTHPNNLPAETTSFVGRESEAEAVVSLLKSAAVRLVTLTGFGGLGKTRLALKVAENALPLFPDGAWFISLAPLRDPDLVMPTIARVLGLEEDPSRSATEQVSVHLGSRRALLVLDNFEQVEDAADHIAELLRACANVKVLVTSRSLLYLSMEHEYEVPPLGRTESVTLFAARAHQARPTFTLSEENRKKVESLCAELDGMPLAVELAAVQARTLSVEEIHQALSQRLATLSSRMRDLSPRQRSLRGAIDWSYELLSPHGQRLFCDLSVFVGSFSVEAATAICERESPDIGADAVRERLQSLREKSLIRAANDAEGRFALLESLRQYGAELVEQSHSGEVLSRRHADYFVGLAGTLSSRLEGTGEAASAMHSMTQDIDNMRKGMDWATAQDEDSLSRDFGMALARYFLSRGPYAEGDARLAVAESACRAAGDDAGLALALLQRGRFALKRHDYRSATRLIEESYEICKRTGQRRRLIPALNNLAVIAHGEGDFAVAAARYSEALDLAREMGLPAYEASLLANLGSVATDEGRLDAAAVYFEDSLALQRQINDPVGIAYNLLNSYDVLRRRKEFAAARARLEESQSLFEDLENQQGIALTKVCLGVVLIEEGRAADAEPYVAEGLSIAREIGDPRCEMYALAAAGRILIARHDLEAGMNRFQRSWAIAREVGDRKHQVDLLKYAGFALVEENRPEAAYQVLQAARRDFARYSLADVRDIESLMEELGSALGREVRARLDAEAAFGDMDALFATSKL